MGHLSVAGLSGVFFLLVGFCAWGICPCIVCLRILSFGVLPREAFIWWGFCLVGLLSGWNFLRFLFPVGLLSGGVFVCGDFGRWVFCSRGFCSVGLLFSRVLVYGVLASGNFVCLGFIRWSFYLVGILLGRGVVLVCQVLSDLGFYLVGL